MRNEEFYGEHLRHMESTKDKAVILAKFAAEFSGAKSARVISRIKTPKSMIKKIQADGLPVNCESALSIESDAIGVRVIVDSISDIYNIFYNIKNIKTFGDTTNCRILNVKDYIRSPKKSGYRSLHIIIGLDSTDPELPEMKVEIQIRTSIMDCWASLEHLVEYKQVIDLTPDTLDLLETYRQAADLEIALLDA